MTLFKLVDAAVGDDEAAGDNADDEPLPVAPTAATYRERSVKELESLDLVAMRDNAPERVSVTREGLRAVRTEYERYKRLFAALDRVELDGVLRTGMGQGKHFVSLEGYDEQFRDRLGYSPYPGTFNVELSSKCLERRARLNLLEPIPIDGWSDGATAYGPARCHPATVETADQSYDAVHVIIPEQTDHDRRQVELIAPDRLRDEFDVHDGDAVAVRVHNEP